MADLRGQLVPGLPGGGARRPGDLREVQGQGPVRAGRLIEEDEAAAKDYATRVGFTFPLVADPQGKIADQYRTFGYPIHFFIGRDGTIKQERIGRLTPSDMEQLVQQLLSG